MERLEFNLEQGWSKGVSFAFENVITSAKLNLDNVIQLNQVHGSDFHEIGHADKGEVAKADGFICRGKELLQGKKIAIRTADCAPLVYVDRESEALALVHAGWRGLAAGIHKKVFENKWMNPKSTWIWLGPCNTGITFEVGDDLIAQFPEYTTDSSVFENENGKKSFHTWKYLSKEFFKLGAEMFYNVEVNSFEDRTYASYRRYNELGLTKEAKEIRNFTWLSV